MEKIVWQQSGEPAAQVLVHVPSLVDFIEAGLLSPLDVGWLSSGRVFGAGKQT